MIEIRRCTENDVASVMEFIDRHWRKAHVLSTSRQLMDWQYKAENEFYNILLAYDEQTLVAILGYIPTRRYDSLLAGNDFLWLALWKVRDDIRIAGLGLRMLAKLGQFESVEAIGVNGLNVRHPSMYLALGYKVGELAHFFMVNPSAKRSLINAPEGLSSWPQPKPGNATSKEMSADELSNLRIGATVIPRKSPNYFIERYLRHPFYKYNVYHVSTALREGLVTTRVATHQGTNALRIVDFLGDAEVLSECGNIFESLMKKQGSEYIDFLQWGIPKSFLEHAGFDQLDPKGETILPNYFEPFLAKNARILCAVKSKKNEPFMVVRGDGDQDRPNMLT
jgi:hypothetical protein